MRNLFRHKPVPMDVYPTPADYNPAGALAFTRESAPSAWVAVMLEIQDRIADATDIVANMATSKEHGYSAYAAGQLVTYDYYRFQTNLAATRSFEQALQIAKAEAANRSAHGEFTVTWSAQESASMDDRERSHIWIEAFINIDVKES